MRGVRKDHFPSSEEDGWPALADTLFGDCSPKFDPAWHWTASTSAELRAIRSTATRLACRAPSCICRSGCSIQPILFPGSVQRVTVFTQHLPFKARGQISVVLPSSSSSKFTPHLRCDGIENGSQKTASCRPVTYASKPQCKCRHFCHCSLRHFQAAPQASAGFCPRLPVCG